MILQMNLQSKKMKTFISTSAYWYNVLALFYWLSYNHQSDHIEFRWKMYLQIRVARTQFTIYLRSASSNARSVDQDIWSTLTSQLSSISFHQLQSSSLWRYSIHIVRCMYALIVWFEKYFGVFFWIRRQGCVAKVRLQFLRNNAEETW